MPPTPRRRCAPPSMALLTAMAVVVVPGAAAAAPPSPFGAAFARQFADPPADARPKIRYWWACGQIEPEEIETEIKAIADRGFAAVEIACMFSTDPGRYGWGGPVLTDRLRRAVEAGRRHGVRVDLTVGPSWPLAVPGLTPDDPRAAQEIAYGRAVVKGGAAYDGPVPAAPEPKTGVTKQTLVAAQAVPARRNDTGTKPVELEKDSLIDLTGSVRDGRIAWTAPDGGEWLLFGYWQRGTGQAPVSGQSVSERAAHVVDHFGVGGAEAATGFLDANVLTPELRRLLKRNGGDLFEDSLELDSAQHWTWDLTSRFRELRGYSLRDNLPVLFIEDIHRQYTSVTPEDEPDFTFGDGSGERVRDDYYRTLTDLYIDAHVRPLRKWAHSRGLSYRAQPYGTTVDTPTIDAAVDVPETESLGGGGGYTDEPSRWIADGAVHLGGKKVYSLECCAAYDHAYAQTWPQMLGHFNTAFAHGVNQVVFHGFANEGALGSPWPGFSPFTMQTGGNGFSEAWGPRQPTWDDTGTITDWTARMQYVLRRGRPSVDLAVYRHEYGAEVQVPNTTGFTHDYVGPDQLDGTRVRGRRLAPDGPAYRALILQQQETLPVETARLLLRHAQRGLPIVIVGDPPSRTPGAHDAARQDAELARIVQRLLAQPSVRRVPDRGALPGTLRGLGVRPSAETGAASGLLTVRRDLDQGRLYYLHNPTSKAITAPVALEGDGRPYELDAWTGEITPVGRYRVSGGRTTVQADLAPGGSTVIALAGRPGGHVTATSAGDVVMRNGRPQLRATESGVHTVTFDDGEQVRVDVPEVDQPVRLDDWTLAVDDWHRGADGSREITRHEMRLDPLRPWSRIPELQDVSGVGTYTTTVRLDDADGARLDLGEVTDTFTVRVNGRVIPPSDQVTGRVDLSGHLRPGENTITVRVATPLRNRLRVTPGFPGQAQQARQDYGLIGPVRLVPYRQIPIQD
ncbi:hypothetical protein BJF79_05780 [Actinomadura sp. CNU-125]|uniref:glycosyl hydrolase n=1 Tax=Actinomadura sp. CNU-125 TaxID=1904961 RepID=UPI0009688040|nr:glycosyl hydrolase [Actinomadura sp. CNU-125]OLT37720.1 hypothetical protein BJF79_05780 [Actinomadura sp. CNU-125]